MLARFFLRSSCSSGACSGPKEMTTRSAAYAAPGSPVRSATRSAPRSFGSVSPSAWSQRVPGSGSTRENRIRCPRFPRIPVFRSSSRHSACRSVSPERASEASASCRTEPSAAASSGFTTGAGTASTVKGPVTRAFPLSARGWS